MNRTNLKGRGVLFRRGFGLLCAAAVCASLAGCGSSTPDSGVQNSAANAEVPAVSAQEIAPGQGNAGADSGAVYGSSGTANGPAAGSGLTDSGAGYSAGASGGADSGAAYSAGVLSGTDSAAAYNTDSSAAYGTDSTSSWASSLPPGAEVNSAEEPAEAAEKTESSVGVGGAILPGIGSIFNIKPADKNELSQYIGMSFSSLEKEFEGIESSTSIGMRSYYLGAAVGNRTHQVGLTGSESGGVITKINLYAGDEYMIAGIKAGMTLAEAKKRAAEAGFEPVGKSSNGLTVYDCPDGLQVTVYSSDGSTVDTVTCENG